MITLTREEAQQVLEALKTLRVKLSEPEPEPLGWIVMHEGMNIDELRICEVEQIGYDEKPMPNQYRVYTAPPQREWVGLTEDEVKDFELFHAVVDAECVRAIEAKLKEKNNG